MAMLIRFTCDRTFDAYSMCAAVSPPATSVEEAERLAEQDGWYLRPRAGHLCPDCSGIRRAAERLSRIRR
jgi:hypothetical protein